jgi:hypothetical protein
VARARPPRTSSVAPIDLLSIAGATARLIAAFVSPALRVQFNMRVVIVNPPLEAVK